MQNISKEEAKKRIEKLREQINYHNYLYYVLDKPEISDAEWDAMFHELQELEQQFPDLLTPDSPTQRVGGMPLKSFKKVKHSVPMQSLNDVKTKDEFQDWYERIKKLLPHDAQLNFYCEYKFDGLSITTIYENQNFILGATRGDGMIGEDVTQNLKTVATVPLRFLSEEKIEERLKELKADYLIPSVIKNLNKRIEVRGEVILTNKEFERVNKEQEKLGLPLYANPRNLAAGSIRQLDPKITARRHLIFVVYKLVTDLGQKTHEEEHKIIEALGFKTYNQVNRLTRSLDEAFKFYDDILAKRENLSFEIDGVVVILNDNKLFDLLGNIGKGPRGAIAFKFPARENITIVEDIKVQVGRTGILTPVAFLKPIQIGGVTITRATLHNKEEIKRLGLKIKDHVVVIRAGDVIPKIIKVLKKLRTGEEKEFEMPKFCPFCHTKLVEEESGILIRCPNLKCPARSQESLIHFVSKHGFDIKGLGPRLLKKFVDEHLIVDPADIFSLEEGDLKVLERLGEKSSRNIIKAIENSKQILLEKFIFALGIPLVGEEASREIAKKIKSLGSIKTPNDVLKIAKKLKYDDWNSLYDFGPKISQSILNYFSSPNTEKLFNKFTERGITIETEAKIPKSKQKLAGLKFVFTGELKSMSREEAHQKVLDLGGIPKESISKDIDYVVVGEKPGSKYEEAKKLGLKIINESEFINLIKE